MIRRRGFTIVELMVAVAIIGILASVVAFSFETWRSSTAKTEVKNNLTTAAAKLKDYQNWNSAYPADQATFDAAYQVSGEVTMTYTRRLDGASYCLNASSKAVNTVIFKIDSSVSATPAAGTCT